MLEEITVGGSTKRKLFLPDMTGAFIKWVAHRLLRWKPDGALIVELPSGDRVRFGKSNADNLPLLKLNNFRVVHKALRRGSIGFAESYIDGDIDCNDLLALFRFFVRNQNKFEKAGRGLFKTRIGDRFAHRRNRNTRDGSRRNIAEHYDLNNDFFRLWLDKNMQYSSALFRDPNVTLEAAQLAKMDHILDLLNLKSGQEILEIGCGWGAMARRAASTRHVHVHGITLSREQLADAHKQAERADPADRCSFQLKDYRDVTGQYDHIVSIEMIEAVGKEYWPQFFNVLNQRLKSGGTALIQAITIHEDRYCKYARKADFIQRYIFPGGMLPTASEIRRQGESAGLTLDCQEHFGQSYATTLREWRMRFEQAWPDVKALGFDERFRRCWRYYLTYCEAGFLESVSDVGLYRFRKT